jgi:hypothetical protein
MENSEKMNVYLAKCKLPKLTQGEVEKEKANYSRRN